jgi:hypothetical protein
MVPLWLAGGPGGFSPILFLRPSSDLVHALSVRVAAKAPCVLALASSRDGGGMSAAGVPCSALHDTHLRFVAYRLRQRYARSSGLAAMCSANDALLIAAALSMLLRAAALVAALSAAAAG